MLLFAVVMLIPDFVYYLIVGVLGALGMSLGRWFADEYIPHFPNTSLLLGKLFARGKSEKTTRVVGRYTHLTTGALWGILFGLLAEQQFFFMEFNIVSGLMFGVVPWLFSLVVTKPLHTRWLPTLTGGGLFALNVGSHGRLTSLVLHLLYGAVVGLVYAWLFRDFA